MLGAEMDIEELKVLREAIEWYRDEALALSINLAGKKDQAVLASVTMLSLDAGHRGINASIALQAIAAKLDAAQKIQDALEFYADAKRYDMQINTIGDKPYIHGINRDGGAIARAALNDNTNGTFRSLKFAIKAAELGDPEGCSKCGAIAGCCDNYPKCQQP